MIAIATLHGVKTSDGDSAEIQRDEESGRLVLMVPSEGGMVGENIDLIDLIQWLRSHKDVWESEDGPVRFEWKGTNWAPVRPERAFGSADEIEITREMLAQGGYALTGWLADGRTEDRTSNEQANRAVTEIIHAVLQGKYNVKWTDSTSRSATPHPSSIHSSKAAS